MTEDQQRSLEDLWMMYGNNGKKCTRGNHYYVQRLVEGRMKDAEQIKKRATNECIDAVQAVLNCGPVHGECSRCGIDLRSENERALQICGRCEAEQA